MLFLPRQTDLNSIRAGLKRKSTGITKEKSFGVDRGKWIFNLLNSENKIVFKFVDKQI
ncbi:hypothetical protein HOLDEFILI_03932 [Holdemania filiformis DSM 12042]|uniref:Uncharacterized protein n=1 Tax=Holdemania filiformis DSM 12042 TaxID=545696 RepID=B9YDK9_9FIRM|nr:hypothetical protein HOLDEFILI_03932 [Holdemania filiformis DSM 12042]